MENIENTEIKYRICEERLSPRAYIAFLKSTDLGSQYPQERFEARIAALVKNVPVSLSARDTAGRLVGVCFGITDFAYWLFITDLGVARDCTGQGIGRALMERALKAAGGKENIILYTCANKDAVPFYQKLGMEKAQDVMVLNQAEWTEFTVV